MRSALGGGQWLSTKHMLALGPCLRIPSSPQCPAANATASLLVGEMRTWGTLVYHETPWRHVVSAGIDEIDLRALADQQAALAAGVIPGAPLPGFRGRHCLATVRSAMAALLGRLSPTWAPVQAAELARRFDRGLHQFAKGNHKGLTVVHAAARGLLQLFTALKPNSGWHNLFQRSRARTTYPTDGAEWERLRAVAPAISANTSHAVLQFWLNGRNDPRRKRLASTPETVLCCHVCGTLREAEHIWFPKGIAVNAGICQQDLAQILQLSELPMWAVGWSPDGGLPLPLKPGSACALTDHDICHLRNAQALLSCSQGAPDSSLDICRLCGHAEDSTEHLLHWCPVVGTCLDLLLEQGGHGHRAFMTGTSCSDDTLVALLLEQVLLLCQFRQHLSATLLLGLLGQNGSARSVRTVMSNLWHSLSPQHRPVHMPARYYPWVTQDNVSRCDACAPRCRALSPSNSDWAICSGMRPLRNLAATRLPLLADRSFLSLRKLHCDPADGTAHGPTSSVCPAAMLLFSICAADGPVAGLFTSDTRILPLPRIACAAELPNSAWRTSLGSCGHSHHELYSSRTLTPGDELVVPYTATPWQGAPSICQAIITWDGSAKPAKLGRPVAGCGIVLFVESGLLGRLVIAQWAVPLPFASDAQQAEAWGSRFAVKLALEAASLCLSHGHRIARVILRGDSGCLAGAFNHKFRLRTPALVDLTLSLHCWLASSALPIVIEHWDRSFNSEADKMADLGAGLLDHLLVTGGAVRYEQPAPSLGHLAAASAGPETDEASLRNIRAASTICNRDCTFSVPPNAPGVLPLNSQWHDLCCAHTASLLSSDDMFPQGSAGLGRLVTLSWETGIYSDQTIAWVQNVPSWTAARRARWMQHIIKHNSSWASKHPDAKRVVSSYATVIAGLGRVYAPECTHLSAGPHLRAINAFQKCFLLDMPAAHLQIFLVFAPLSCPLLKHYLREKDRWRAELAHGFNCSKAVAKKLFTLLLCGSPLVFQRECQQHGILFLAPPFHDPLRVGRFQGLFNGELTPLGMPQVILTMFDEVQSNRQRVTHQLKLRKLFVNRPSAHTSPVRCMAACLEAAESCIFAIFARLLFQRFSCVVEGYIHDAVLVPNTISCAAVVSVFREASARALGCPLDISSVPWEPLLQEAFQQVPISVPRRLCLQACEASSLSTPRPTVRRVRRNTGKRRTAPQSAPRRRPAAGVGPDPDPPLPAPGSQPLACGTSGVAESQSLQLHPTRSASALHGRVTAGSFLVLPALRHCMQQHCPAVTMAEQPIGWTDTWNAVCQTIPPGMDDSSAVILVAPSGHENPVLARLAFTTSLSDNNASPPVWADRDLRSSCNKACWIWATARFRLVILSTSATAARGYGALCQALVNGEAFGEHMGPIAKCWHAMLMQASILQPVAAQLPQLRIMQGQPLRLFGYACDGFTDDQPLDFSNGIAIGYNEWQGSPCRTLYDLLTNASVADHLHPTQLGLVPVAPAGSYNRLPTAVRTATLIHNAEYTTAHIRIVTNPRTHLQAAIVAHGTSIHTVKRAFATAAILYHCITEKVSLAAGIVAAVQATFPDLAPHLHIAPQLDAIPHSIHWDPLVEATMKPYSGTSAHHAAQLCCWSTASSSVNDQPTQAAVPAATPAPAWTATAAAMVRSITFNQANLFVIVLPANHAFPDAVRSFCRACPTISCMQAPNVDATAGSMANSRLPDAYAHKSATWITAALVAAFAAQAEPVQLAIVLGKYDIPTAGIECRLSEMTTFFSLDGKAWGMDDADIHGIGPFVSMLPPGSPPPLAEDEGPMLVISGQLTTPSPGLSTAPEALMKASIFAQGPHSGQEHDMIGNWQLHEAGRWTSATPGIAALRSATCTLPPGFLCHCPASILQQAWMLTSSLVHMQHVEPANWFATFQACINSAGIPHYQMSVIPTFLAATPAGSKLCGTFLRLTNLHRHPDTVHAVLPATPRGSVATALQGLSPDAALAGLAAGDDIPLIATCISDWMKEGVAALLQEGCFLASGAGQDLEPQVFQDATDLASAIIAHTCTDSRGVGRESFGAHVAGGHCLWHPSWRQFAQLPCLTAFFDALKKQCPEFDYVLHGGGGDFCSHLATEYQPLHSDYSVRRLPEQFRHTPPIAVNMYACNVDRRRGPLRIIPGPLGDTRRIASFPGLNDEPVHWLRSIVTGRQGDMIFRFETQLHGGTPHEQYCAEPRVMLLLQFYHREHEQWLYSQAPFKRHLHDGPNCPACIEAELAGPFDMCVVHHKLHAAPIPALLADTLGDHCLACSVGSDVPSGLLKRKPKPGNSFATAVAATVAASSSDQWSSPNPDAASTAPAPVPMAGCPGMSSALGIMRHLGHRPNFWATLPDGESEFAVGGMTMAVRVRVGPEPSTHSGRIVIAGMASLGPYFDNDFLGVQVGIGSPGYSNSAVPPDLETALHPDAFVQESQRLGALFPPATGTFAAPTASHEGPGIPGASAGIALLLSGLTAKYGVNQWTLEAHSAGTRLAPELMLFSLHTFLSPTSLPCHLTTGQPPPQWTVAGIIAASSQPSLQLCCITRCLIGGPSMALGNYQLTSQLAEWLHDNSPCNDVLVLARIQQDALCPTSDALQECLPSTLVLSAAGELTQLQLIFGANRHSTSNFFRSLEVLLWWEKATRCLNRELAATELVQPFANGKQDRHERPAHGLVAIILTCLHKGGANGLEGLWENRRADEEATANAQEQRARDSVAGLVDCAVLTRASHRLIQATEQKRWGKSLTAAQAYSKLWPSGPHDALSQLMISAGPAASEERAPADGLPADPAVSPDDDFFLPAPPTSRLSEPKCRDPATCALLALALCPASREETGCATASSSLSSSANGKALHACLRRHFKRLDIWQWNMLVQVVAARTAAEYLEVFSASSSRTTTLLHSFRDPGPDRPHTLEHKLPLQVTWPISCITEDDWLAVVSFGSDQQNLITTFAESRSQILRTSFQTFSGDLLLLYLNQGPTMAFGIVLRCKSKTSRGRASGEAAEMQVAFLKNEWQAFAAQLPNKQAVSFRRQDGVLKFSPGRDPERLMSLLSVAPSHRPATSALTGIQLPRPQLLAWSRKGTTGCHHGVIFGLRMAICLSFNMDTLAPADMAVLMDKWAWANDLPAKSDPTGACLLHEVQTFAAALASQLDRQYAAYRTVLAALSTRSSLLIALGMATDGQRLCPIFGPPGTGKTFGEAILLIAVLVGLLMREEQGCLAVFSQPNSAIYQFAQDLLGLVRNAPLSLRMAHIMAGDAYSKFVGGEGDPTGLTLCISGPAANPVGLAAARQPDEQGEPTARLVLMTVGVSANQHPTVAAYLGRVCYCCIEEGETLAACDGLAIGPFLTAHAVIKTIGDHTQTQPHTPSALRGLRTRPFATRADVAALSMPLIRGQVEPINRTLLRDLTKDPSCQRHHVLTSSILQQPAVKDACGRYSAALAASGAPHLSTTGDASAPASVSSTANGPHLAPDTISSECWGHAVNTADTSDPTVDQALVEALNDPSAWTTLLCRGAVPRSHVVALSLGLTCVNVCLGTEIRLSKAHGAFVGVVAYPFATFPGSAQPLPPGPDHLLPLGDEAGIRTSLVFLLAKGDYRTTGGRGNINRGQAYLAEHAMAALVREFPDIFRSMGSRRAGQPLTSHSLRSTTADACGRDASALRTGLGGRLTPKEILDYLRGQDAGIRDLQKFADELPAISRVRVRPIDGFRLLHKTNTNKEILGRTLAVHVAALNTTSAHAFDPFDATVLLSRARLLTIIILPPPDQHNRQNQVMRIWEPALELAGSLGLILPCSGSDGNPSLDECTFFERLREPLTAEAVMTAASASRFRRSMVLSGNLRFVQSLLRHHADFQQVMAKFGDAEAYYRRPEEAAQAGTGDPDPEPFQPPAAEEVPPPLLADCKVLPWDPLLRVIRTDGEPHGRACASCQ